MPHLFGALRHTPQVWEMLFEAHCYFWKEKDALRNYDPDWWAEQEKRLSEHIQWLARGLEEAQASVAKAIEILPRVPPWLVANLYTELP